MPTRKAFDKYPEVYARYFRAACERGSCMIMCSYPNRAKQLRQDLYNYRAAAINTNKAESLGIALIAHECMISVEDNWVVIYSEETL